MRHHGVAEDDTSFAPIHSDHDYNFLAARRRRILSELFRTLPRSTRVELSPQSSTRAREWQLGFNEIES